MIKNERQYKITKAQAARFSNTLESLRQKPDADNRTPPLLPRPKRTRSAVNWQTWKASCADTNL